MKSIEEYQLIRVNEVARLLAISRRTLERLVSAGKLPRPIKIGGCSRFRHSDIIAYIENANQGVITR
jgi:excisionase family DNA binding protein